MTVIRTISVGLAIAAYLVVSYAAEFMNWAQHGLPLYVNALAVHMLSPTTGQMVGDTAYLPAAFVLGCVAIGLFSSSILWPRIENLLTAPLRIYQNVQNFRALKQYNAELATAEQVKN